MKKKVKSAKFFSLSDWEPLLAGIAGCIWGYLLMGNSFASVPVGFLIGISFYGFFFPEKRENGCSGRCMCKCHYERKE